MAYEDDVLVAESLSEKDQIKTEKDLGSVSTMTILASRRRVGVKENSVVIKKRDTSQESIWGRENWGEAIWQSSSFSNSFVFDRVVNNNRTWGGSYFNPIFKDTSSTATWSSDGQISFSAGQNIITNPIYLNEEDINSATIKASYSGDLHFFLNNQTSGSQFNTLTNSAKTTFLYAHYKFDGNPSDSSSYAKHLTPFNISYTSGKISSGAFFNGTNAYLSGSMAYSNLADASYCCWIYPTNLNSRRTIFSHRGNVALYLETDGSLVFTAVGGGTRASFTTLSPIQTNSWSHLAVVFYGENNFDYVPATNAVDIYLNGNLLEEIRTTASDTGGIATSTLFIGMFTSGDGYFSGIIDDFRIYNFRLTQEDVAYLYNSGDGRDDDFIYTSSASTRRFYGRHKELTIATTASPSYLNFGSSQDHSYFVRFKCFSIPPLRSTCGLLSRQRNSMCIQLSGSANRDFFYVQAGLRSGSSVVSVTSSGLLTATTYSVASTYNASSKILKAYINGSLAGQVTCSFNFIPNSPLVLGGGTNQVLVGSGWSGFYGEIDDCLIYDKILTDTEVSQLHAGDIVSPSNLKARYSFDEEDINKNITRHFDSSQWVYAKNSSSVNFYTSGQYLRLMAEATTTSQITSLEVSY